MFPWTPFPNKSGKFLTLCDDIAFAKPQEIKVIKPKSIPKHFYNKSKASSYKIKSR